MDGKKLLISMIPGGVRPFLRKVARKHGYPDAEEFSFDQKNSVKDDIVSKYGSSDLVDIYVNNEDNVVHKWHHYLSVYDRYFSHFRNRPVRFLEIGVSQGGSLQMWRKYFGDQAIIYGIDIDETCRRFDGQAAQVRIGSQDDPAFLRAVVEEMGGVDFVLDDGSHHMPHIKVSLETLFPLLADNGVYMIEDLHTAYWWRWGGGYRSSRNFFRYVDQIISDMHRWYHKRKTVHAGIGDLCSGVHVHDSIVVLDKGPTHRPVHSRIGARPAETRREDA